MAVPHRRNGFNEDEEWENEEDERMEDDEGWIDLGEPEVHVSRELRAAMDAAEVGDVDALRLALDNLNGSIDQPAEDGDTALHLACLYGYTPCVQLLLERRASLDSKDEDGAIPLHDACAGGFVDIVQALLNAAENKDHIKRLLDTADTDGDTPLHHAARGEHLEVVQMLLNAGASPNVTNVLEKTAADLSESGTEVRQVLDAAARAMIIS
jgi:ankyrin repeat protein